MSRTLQSLVAEGDRNGAAPAVIAFEGRAIVTWSYSELHQKALRLAAGILDYGLVAGDRAAVIAPNSPDLIVLRLALVVAGIVAVPLDDQASSADLERSILDAGAVALVTTSESLTDSSDSLSNLVEYLIAIGPDAPPRARTLDSLSGDPNRSFPVSDPGDLVAIIYTSGTTGRAKGVPLTHANFLANIDALAAGGYLDARDRTLLPLPLHHAYPFMAGLMVPFVCGAAVVLPASVSGPDIATALKEAQVTVMAGVPRLYEAMAQGLRARIADSGTITGAIFGTLLRLSITLRQRLGIRAGWVLMRPVRARFAPKLRMLASGGAKLDEAAAWTLEGLGFEVLTGYGLVETSSVSTYNRRGAGRIGTEGKPAPGTDIRIDSPDEDGIGEVHIHGPHVFAGYYNDPETTADAFSSDGWFKTGDLGRIDPDGSLVIVGRLKEVIVLAGGKNVAPETVERALTSSPFINDAAVLELKGDLVALVVPEIVALQKTGTARLDELMRIAVTETCIDLAPYERVTGYRIWRQSLPKTRLGKLQRFALPEMYAAAERADAAAPATIAPDDEMLLEHSTARAVIDSMRRRFPGRVISLDTSPQLDLGVDSLGWIEIAHELEAEMGVALSEDMLAEVVTIRDLLRQVTADDEPAEIVPATAPPPPTRFLVAVGWVIYWLNRLVMRTAFRMHIGGALPAEPRRVLVTVNHNSDLDALFVAAALPWRFARHVWWGADVMRLYTTGVRRLFTRATQIFPVDDRRPSSSLSQARELLERDESVIWFPESWRSADGELQSFSRGIGVLIQETEPAVVPTWVGGSFEALPRHRRWPRFIPITVTFGPEVPARSLIPAEPGPDPAAEIAAAVRARVAALGPGAADAEPARFHQPETRS